MRLRNALGGLIVVSATLIAGCNGSSPVISSTPTVTVTATPTPVPTATPVPSASGTLTTSTTATTTSGLGPIGGGYNGTMLVPPGPTVATQSITFSIAKPAGAPTVASVARLPKTIGGAAILPIAFWSVTSNVTATFPKAPDFQLQFPTGVTPPASALTYIAVYDPTNAGSGWTTLEGPASTLSVNPATYGWTAPNVPFTFTAAQAYYFVAFSNAGSLVTPTPVPTPTPTPSPTPTPTPTPTATPTPSFGALTLTPGTVSFTAAGQTGTFTATETSYAGPITAANGTPTCTGIATFAPASGTGPGATFTVTAVAAGTCQINVTDNHGGSSPETVIVTTTTGTINSKPH